MDKLSLSVVVITKNEEKRIADCLNSVLEWADEVIVVDDCSSDQTQDIARELGAKVLVRRMDIEGRHRNWAYQQAKNDWVFSLDSDERPTEELKDEIKEIILANPREAAFSIPRRNFLGDYWLRWGGQYPSPQIKLIKKDKFRWEESHVHPKSLVNGKVGMLKNDILHYTYRGWEDFLIKLNNQTSLEAQKWYAYSLINPKKARYKMNFVHTLWRTLDRFVRSFIAKRGYRDRFRGFMVAYFASVYQMVSYAKYKTLVAKSKE